MNMRASEGDAMEVAVIGTGFIGGILGNALAGSGHAVTFGSRRPDDDHVAAGSIATVASVSEAISRSDVIVLALPGAAVAGFTSDNRDGLDGKLVIDATNRMGESVS